MKYVKAIYIQILLASCFAGPVLAQDTMRIDVIKPFIATLSDAMKIQSNPNPEVPQIKKDTFTYETPVIVLQDVPTAYTIKPLSLGTSLLPKLRTNYIRLGYGNYNSPLTELYLNTTRNRNLQGGFYLKNIASNTTDSRSYSNTSAAAYGKKFISKGILDAGILFERNAYKLYGYEYDGNTLKNNPAQPNNISNKFTLFELKGGYANVRKDTAKLGYDLHAKYYNFATDFNESENNFLLDGVFSQSIQGNPLRVYAAVQTNTIKDSTGELGRVFVDLNPTYQLRMNRAYLLLGFNSAFASDSDGTKFHFYPKAEFGYTLIPNGGTLYGGIRGDLNRYTLRSIYSENPFVRMPAFANTLNQFEMYAGIKGIISPQTSFVIEASLSSVKNLMFYVSDSGLYNQRPIYDKSTAALTHIRTELNHEFGEQFQLGFAMNYYHYSLSIAAPYSRPTFTTSTHLLYNIGNKFNIRSEIYTMNERKSVIINPGSVLTPEIEVTMAGLVDLNIGFDYRYNRSVMVFLNLNNITNNQYQRWVNLPVYGINVMGGLTISF